MLVRVGSGHINCEADGQVYEVELEIVGIENPVAPSVVAISNKELGSGHGVPDGGPYTLRHSLPRWMQYRTNICPLLIANLASSHALSHR
jgi:hypothetical protein